MREWRGWGRAFQGREQQEHTGAGQCEKAVRKRKSKTSRMAGHEAMTRAVGLNWAPCPLVGI